MSVDKDNSELEYDIGAEESDTDVEVKDGTEEQVQDSGQEQQTAHSNELDSVSDAVQKRISKLTARMREAERREQAALEYARGVQTQQQSLQQRLMQSDYQRMNETKNRIDTQMVALRQIIKKAREEGDIDTETEAQSRLTDLTVEGRQIAGMLQQSGNAAAQPQREQQVPQQAYQPQQKPAPKPSARAQQWADDNSWFGKDRVMTYVAWGIHQSLIEQEGIDPESEEYYTELDSRLRKEIPHKFQESQFGQNRQQRSAPAVAPASRGQAGVNSHARRQVRLKPSQVAIAKKLGVPLEEYAKYVKE